MTETGDDSQGFEALYRSLHPLVVRTVYLVVFDAEVAQEVTHEAFLRLWQHRHELGDHANEKAWLMRVAYNLAIDHRRSLLNALRHRGGEAPVPDPGTLAIARLEIEQMRRALVRLPARDRAILALRFDQGLSFSEIASIVSRPEATVRTRVHRAIDKLRRRLAGREDSPAPVGEELS